MWVFLKAVGLAFIPVFVAMDFLGGLPIYIGLTAEMRPRAKRKIVREATLVAALIGVIFLFAGKAVFSLLGITVADFQVAGGILLLILAVNDILGDRAERRTPDESVGIVPLGMPLIIGPAALTTLLVTSNELGVLPTLIGFAANLVIIFVGFTFGGAINRIIGNATSTAVSKIMYMLLAAIAVMMIRRGLMVIVPQLLGAG